MVSKNTHRLERIEEQIRRDLAVILHSQVNDPRLKSLMVTEVAVSRDLSYAKIFFQLPPEQVFSSALKQALKKATPFFRKALSECFVDLRVLPQLQFIYDDQSLQAEKLQQLIHEAVTSSSEN